MRRLNRRRFVSSTGAVIAAVALAGCGNGGGDGGNGEVPEAIDEHLQDANLYEGEIDDQTGQDEATVDVGAGDGLAFDPPAVRVDAGTTVVWEWTGEGGGHNVASTDESDTDFRTEVTDEEGHTFEETFDEAGNQLYECEPHAANGMLGGIDVVEE